MEYQATGNYYVLGHVKVITGLSERTLRSYISLGLLKGEKINGMWHFTEEQLGEFLVNPSVRPSILAKKHAIIWDFLADSKKKRRGMLHHFGHPARRCQTRGGIFLL